MPQLSFIANQTTDQLTITAHGFVTGDGPATVYATAGNAVPGGTTPLTDYWIIRVDADHIQLATSSANALNGVAVDLLSNGTGTMYLLIGVPYRRRRTYANLSQLIPVDLNELQDHQVALWNLFTGQAQSVYTGITLPPNFDITVSGTGRHKHGTLTVRYPAVLGAGLTDGAAWGIENGGGIDQVPFTSWLIPFSLPDGKRITAVRARVKDNATGPSKISFSTGSDVDGTTTSFGGAGTVSSGSGAYQTLSRSGLSVTVSSGTTYFASFTNSTGTAFCVVQWVEVDFDDI